jgi:hypothetical protein
MTRSGEFQNGEGQNLFVPNSPESELLRTRKKIVPIPITRERALPVNQVTITAAQILTVCTIVLCFASLSVWMVRYWLFAR